MFVIGLGLFGPICAMDQRQNVSQWFAETQVNLQELCNQYGDELDLLRKSTANKTALKTKTSATG